MPLNPKLKKCVFYELPNLSLLCNHKIHTEKAYGENYSNVWVGTRTSIGPSLISL